MTDLEGCSAPTPPADSGQEKRKTCPDCGVQPGQRHDSGCDVSRCPECGVQAVQCGEHLDAGQSTWTGEWPGDVECREWDWWTTIVLLGGRRQVVENLNRLPIAAARGEIYWDKAGERYRKRDDRSPC